MQYTVFARAENIVGSPNVFVSNDNIKRKTRCCYINDSINQNTKYECNLSIIYKFCFTLSFQKFLKYTLCYCFKSENILNTNFKNSKLTYHFTLFYTILDYFENSSNDFGIKRQTRFFSFVIACCLFVWKMICQGGIYGKNSFLTMHALRTNVKLCRKHKRICK